MNAKKYVILLVSVLSSTLTLLYLLYFFVNPEQIYATSITEKKFFYTKEFSRSQFKKLKYDKYHLIFGTSQSHAIGSKMMNENSLNFHNLYAEPGDIINFMTQLNHKQIRNIKSIIYLIDLRSGARRIDKDLIDYENDDKIFQKLNYYRVTKIFRDIRRNISSKYKSYLESDGSVYYIDPAKHIKGIPYYGTRNSAKLEFDDNLIKGIKLINEFSNKNKIPIKYITPVTNDKYFSTVDLSDLYIFYKRLIESGVENISLYYYINGLSNLKSIDGSYIAFHEKDHLNQQYVKYWLNQYIMNKKDNFNIKSIEDLNRIFEEYKLIQNSYYSNALN